MTTHRTKFCTFKFIRDEVVCRIDRLRHADHCNAEDRREQHSLRRRYFPQLAIARQLEQEQRALQDGIDRAQQVVDRTLALIRRPRDSDILSDGQQARRLASPKAGPEGRLQDAA